MRLIMLILGCFLHAYAQAETNMLQPSDAFNAGKDFANTAKAGAANQVNNQTGTQNLPYYSTNAPETGHFQGGKGLVGTFGTNKQTGCKTSRAESDFLQQECDAVNFLSKNSTQRQKFVIDKKTDPLLVGSKDVINSPGSIPGASTQQCRVVTETKPATYTKEACTEAYGLENLSCSKILTIKQNPGCTPGQYLGRILKNICPRCSDPYIVGDVHCSGTDQGYTISVWTSKTPDGNAVFQRMVNARAIPGNVGLSQGNTLIGDFGNRCHFPLYYSQTCNDQTCTMQLSLIGSTCNGQSFSAPGSYQIPFTYSDSWEDQCTALDARLQ